MKQQKGFTLMELMVVVVIVGIIGEVLQSRAYSDYVRRGRLTRPRKALSDARIKMELLAQDNPTTGYANPAAICPAASTYFAYDCNTPAATKSTYTLTATGNGKMAGFVYTVNELNARTSATPWGNSATCWITKKGVSC